MAISLLPLLQALHTFMQHHASSFTVASGHRAILRFDVRVANNLQLAPLALDFVYTPLTHATVVPGCSLKGRKCAALGIGGWNWGYNSEMKLAIHCDGLTPLDAVNSLISTVPRSTPVFCVCARGR
jgi:hypothetical protein